MNFDSIVAFGDSHVAGAEIIDGIWNDFGLHGRMIRSDELTKPLAFPAIVAQHFDVPWYNYAMSGASNQRNLRKLTSVIHQHPNSLVLYGYTSSTRQEFYMPNDEKFLVRDGDFVQFQPALVDARFDRQNDMYSLYYTKFYNYRSHLGEIMFCVDSICQTHAADYIHIPIYSEVKDAELSPLIKNILQFDQDDNYLDWGASKEFTMKPYTHYGQEAHDALAELIINYYNLLTS